MKKKQYKAVFRTRIELQYDELRKKNYSRMNRIIRTNITRRKIYIMIFPTKLSG